MSAGERLAIQGVAFTAPLTDCTSQQLRTIIDTILRSDEWRFEEKGAQSSLLTSSVICSIVILDATLAATALLYSPEWVRRDPRVKQAVRKGGVQQIGERLRALRYARAMPIVRVLSYLRRKSTVGRDALLACGTQLASTATAIVRLSRCGRGIVANVLSYHTGNRYFVCTCPTSIVRSTPTRRAILKAARR